MILTVVGVGRNRSVRFRGESVKRAGVLRLRGCFAMRSGHSAQDDNSRVLRSPRRPHLMLSPSPANRPKVVIFPCPAVRVGLALGCDHRLVFSHAAARRTFRRTA
jgi:hypothetical protein